MKIKKSEIKGIFGSSEETKQKPFKAFALKLCKRLLTANTMLETVLTTGALCCIALALLYDDIDFFQISLELHNGRKGKKEKRKNNSNLK